MNETALYQLRIDAPGGANIHDVPLSVEIADGQEPDEIRAESDRKSKALQRSYGIHGYTFPDESGFITSQEIGRVTVSVLPEWSDRLLVLPESIRRA